MSRISLRSLVIAALGASALASADALAADCPQDKVGANVTPPGPSAPVGVTDTVIASIDLAPLGSGFDGRKMRMRKLVIAPGGIVPWHSHATRPSNIYIMSGSITEYRSTCSVPIEHGTGDVTAEFGTALEHWWKNNTDKETVIIAADILPPDMKPAAAMPNGPM